MLRQGRFTANSLVHSGEWPLPGTAASVLNNQRQGRFTEPPGRLSQSPLPNGGVSRTPVHPGPAHLWRPCDLVRVEIIAQRNRRSLIEQDAQPRLSNHQAFFGESKLVGAVGCALLREGTHWPPSPAW